MNKLPFAVLLVLLPCAAWSQKLKDFSIEATESMGSHHNSLQTGSVEADRIPLRELLAFAYGVPAVRVTGPSWLDDCYNVNTKANAGEEDQFLTALQHSLTERLHLRVEHSTKQMDVYVLTQIDSKSPKLKSGSGASSMHGQNGSITVENASISDINSLLTRALGRPVVDGTGLAGSFSFELGWQAGDRDSLVKNIREQLGLAVTQDRRKVDVLAIDRN